MVGLALTYFFIYVVRQGVTSWFVFYLLQVTPVCVALFSGLLHGLCVSGWIVGCLGQWLCASLRTDRCFLPRCVLLRLGRLIVRGCCSSCTCWAPGCFASVIHPSAGGGCGASAACMQCTSSPPGVDFRAEDGRSTCLISRKSLAWQMRALRAPSWT